MFCSVVGRQRFIRDKMNAALSMGGSVKDTVTETLHFYKPAANNHMTDKLAPPKINQVVSPGLNLKKRKQESSSCDAAHQSPPTKCLSSSSFTAEDLDLLNSY